MKRLARQLRVWCCPLALLVALPSLAGCGEKEAPDARPLPKPVAKVQSAAPTDAPAEATASTPAPGAPKADAAVPEAIPTTAQAQAEMVAPNVNHKITGAMHQYLDKKGALPDRLDQLVAEGFIKKLPAPPAGKRFFINTNNLQVEVVDR